MAAFISIKTCISKGACVDGIIRALRSKPDSTSIDEPLALHELSECKVEDLLWAVAKTFSVPIAARLDSAAMPEGILTSNPFYPVHRRARLNLLLESAGQHEKRGPSDPHRVNSCPSAFTPARGCATVEDLVEQGLLAKFKIFLPKR